MQWFIAVPVVSVSDLINRGGLVAGLRQLKRGFKARCVYRR